MGPISFVFEIKFTVGELSLSGLFVNWICTCYVYNVMDPHFYSSTCIINMYSLYHKLV